jgi:hypothetical protein
MYFWPVWLIGFIFAGWSYYEGTRFLHVPSHAKVVEKEGNFIVENDDPASKDFAKRMHSEMERDSERHPRISHHKSLGFIYCVVLLLVILSSTVTLRGLWSWMIIIIIPLIVFIIYQLGWLSGISAAVGNVHIYIGFAGYLFISVVLLIMWCVSTFAFDPLIYVKFREGQMEVREAVGEGSKSYDMAGMQIEKLQTDLFRHKVLGLAWLGFLTRMVPFLKKIWPWGGGTGDIVIRTSGAQAHMIELKNVFNIDEELNQIEVMQRQRQVVAAP